MDSYLVKPRIYMDRDGLAEILQGRKKAFIVTDRFMHESGKVSYITDTVSYTHLTLPTKA